VAGSSLHPLVPGGVVGRPLGLGRGVAAGRHGDADQRRGDRCVGEPHLHWRDVVVLGGVVIVVYLKRQIWRHVARPCMAVVGGSLVPRRWR
jgi:hypothetical protein